MQQILDWLEKILAEPTASVPDAGRAVADLSRNQSYVAAKRGDFPVMAYGRKLRVPTRWIRQQLMIDES